MAKIGVVSYNLLSTNLAAPFYHIGSDPGHLRTEYRSELVKRKLLEEIKAGRIICLQEVSEVWSLILSPFFEEQKYGFVFRTFGKGKWGGIAIAYPKIYSIANLEFVHVGSILPKPVIPPRVKVCIFLLSILLKLFCCKKWKQTDYEIAATKDNILLSILFVTDKGEKFCVSTYHMPCAFTQPVVMRLHITTSIKAVTKFAGTYPLIFAGDFNIKRDSPVYLITPLANAYEKEPTHTCHTITKDNTFTGTIDHILYTPSKLKVARVHPLPDVPTARSHPSKDEPSDHLLIGADMEIITA